MKTVIISYSATGNNYALASSIAKRLKIDHIRITNPSNKVTFSTIMKHVLNIIPKVNPSPEIINKYDFVILCAPIWMGKPVISIKPYLSYLKKNPHKYSFITLCGGAIEFNRNLKDKFLKIVGKEPLVFCEYHITSFFSDSKNVQSRDLMNYKVNEKEIKLATDKILKDLKKVI